MRVVWPDCAPAIRVYAAAGWSVTHEIPDCAAYGTVSRTALKRFKAFRFADIVIAIYFWILVTVRVTVLMTVLDCFTAFPFTSAVSARVVTVRWGAVQRRCCMGLGAVADAVTMRFPAGAVSKRKR